MLITTLFSLFLQSAPPPLESGATSRHSALPALAAKAPGHPEYGLHITSAEGQFIFTNLRFTPGNPKGLATLYRVTGPAGMGPYRLGVQLGGPSHFTRPELYQGSFFDIKKALEGGAARATGLDEDWSILSVDGQTFGWNISALISYMSTRPAIDVLALKVKGWQVGYKQKTFRIQLRKLDTPADPLDGVLVPEQVEALQPYLKDSRIWSELVTLRAALPRFQPLPLELAGQRMWAVRGVRNPHPGQGERSNAITLEFWREDPALAPKQNHPAALWVEPEDGLRGGRILQVEGHWYRIQEAAVDAASGRLLRFSLTPWTADVTGLVVGASPARDLGPGTTVLHQEALEQDANDTLVEWKTRTLPGVLATQGLGPTEDLVVRVEKGLLRLDLDVKGIRSRLDARARAEAEGKAQAELAAKGGKTPPQALPPPAESERLADLLDQRKAILMAILGSAKQTLATLRR
jgi:hypothetical protein